MSCRHVLMGGRQAVLMILDPWPFAMQVRAQEALQGSGMGGLEGGDRDNTSTQLQQQGSTQVCEGGAGHGGGRGREVEGVCGGGKAGSGCTRLSNSLDVRSF